ncbi:MAG: 50S ribosomal protein L11 methyltransferase [Muribaculaceae bacterium]|nr:50S ribosomal protein L11 methyltransferase [Muribaculaceae bacterium]
MNDYIALRIDINPCSEDTTDLMAAFLADEGYESFEPDLSGLTAYIKADDYEEDKINDILAGFPLPVSTRMTASLVEGQDWNSEWEKHYFQPILINGRCVVHSTFHKNVPHAEYDILIDPKMAFGTGHHATTSMMVRHLLSIPLEGKNIMDMGTGTGILAILAAQRGAGSVTGIEIDPAACSNAEENFRLNNVEVTLLPGDSARLLELRQKADIFLANINRNVILADLGRYADALVPGGHMYLSGFYQSDIPMILKAASLYGLRSEGELLMHDPSASESDPAADHGPWASLHLVKMQ